MQSWNAQIAKQGGGGTQVAWQLPHLPWLLKVMTPLRHPLQNGTRNGCRLCRMSLNQFGFALFYSIYIFFGILYIAVGVKIVF